VTLLVKMDRKAKEINEYEAIFTQIKQYIRTQVLDRLCNLTLNPLTWRIW